MTNQMARWVRIWKASIIILLVIGGVKVYL